ncbi:MAG: hypothetical protein IJX76_01390 [Clostridia bacterium]|nr:hypothetical protein [Clostridia bacterium]
MGHFVELCMELLFGLSKGSPEKMPEIEYTDYFVIKHPRKKTLVKICATLVWIIVFLLLWAFIKHETRYLYAIFIGLGVVLLSLSVHAFSFQCSVDDGELLRSSFWIFKKKILWKDVSCVRVLEESNEKTVTIALYNMAGRWMIDFNTDMENAWYVIKMAEHKAICIQQERDLPIDKLGRL